MNEIAWITDIHLDRLIERDYLEYKDYLKELNPECLVLSGDIADGEKLFKSLSDFDDSFAFPIYFVLGNHDFYYHGFDAGEQKIRELVDRSKNLHWLSESGIIELNDTTAMIGVEGWGDARNGTVNLSEGYSNDILKIPDYHGLNPGEIAALMQSRGERNADKLRPILQEAVKKYRQIILVTHVPPFVEACFDRSLRIIAEYKQPFYTCQAIGDLLLEVMSENPKSDMLVLCGHTHEKADVKILENLRVRVKESGYGSWWEATILDLHKL